MTETVLKATGNALWVTIAFTLLFIVLPWLVCGFELKAGKFVSTVFKSLLIGYSTNMVIVYILSFLKILYLPTYILGVLVALFLYLFVYKRKQTLEKWHGLTTNIYRMTKGIYRPSLIIFPWIKRKLKVLGRFILAEFRQPVVMLVILGATAYAMYLRLYHSFTQEFYGASDMYVHLQWLAEMKAENIFSSGVYPYAMHNMLYAISAVFRIDTVILMKFISVPISLLILMGVYFFASRIFRSRYACAVGFAAYCVCDIVVMGAYQRQGFAVPQEMAMVFMLPAVCFFLEFIKTNSSQSRFWFTLTFAMCISTHIYPAMMLFIYCLVFFIFSVRRIFKTKGMFLKIVISALMVIVTFAVPLGTGVVLGKGVEPSFVWAFDIMQGKEWVKEETETVVEEHEYPESLSEKLEPKNILEYVRIDGQNTIKEPWFLITLGMFALGLIYAVILLFSPKVLIRSMKRMKHEASDEDINDEREALNAQKWCARGLICFLFSLLVFLALMFMKYFGLPEIMPIERLATYIAISAALSLAIPVEIFFNVCFKRENRFIPVSLSLVLTACGVFALFKFWALAPVSYAFQYQYNGAVRACESIKDNFPKNQWTIVSPVEENAMVMSRGYHFELSDFIVWQERSMRGELEKEEPLTIDTPYVFFYLEKTPLEPDRTWRYFNGEYPPENEPALTYADSQRDLFALMDSYKAYENDVYTELELRRVLEAKLALWVEAFRQYYPDEFTVYYEDDEIVVYKFEQSMYFLTDMTFDYSDVTALPKELKAE